MEIHEQIYRRTAEGDRAWCERDDSLPTGERRVLGLIDVQMHYEAVRSYLSRYDEEQVRAWLASLLGRGLLESVPHEAGHDLDFTGSFRFSDLTRR